VQRPDVTRRKVFLCTGSRCRRFHDKDGRLRDTLAGLPVTVERVPCQKVCRGPVVGFVLDGQREWFERMNSSKALAALGRFVNEARVSKPLAKRRNKKRSGKLRD